MSRIVFSAFLLLNFYLAKVSILDLGAANGFNDAMNVYLEAEPTRFTSLKPLDSLLTLLVAFFKPIADGKDVPLTLFCVVFGGQLVPLYLLVLVESMRSANRERFITYPSVWGVTWQLMTIGITLPCYFLTWIWTSPIPAAAASSPEDFAAAISIDQVQGAAVTGAWVLGFILPSIALGIPSPQLISESTQAKLLAFWQAFPIWTSLAHFVISALVSALDVVPKTSRNKPSTKIARFNQIYSYALVPAAVLYLGVLGLIYARAGSLTGGLLSASELAAAAFRPTWPWDATPVASFEKGVLTMLQWDLYMSSAASWIWVSYMAYVTAGVGGMVRDVGKLVALSAVLGPGGAALAVVWGRDVGAIRAGAAAGGKK
ncbi:hypothetical protein CMUS01_10726 [Colletotrichum musicola]|uniref:Uncharacterized protein n=1 Tax=Colletotrichum musicola TaxID=2175873 RepID=A0A8H6K2T5_9PEZI|nr:hypothetical protein CMUS01_10726 [Colletotrichum musicola]